MKALHHLATATLLVLLTLGRPTGARASLPEPDNVLYGTIVIGSTPVTAGDTDVVIEARRISDGAVIASYRMGSDAGLGNHYALNLKLESVGPATQADASQLGDDLHIVLTDVSGVVGQTPYQIAERGSVQRVDFGAPVGDADGNGLPDLWELAYLGTAGGDPHAVMPNGQTALQNYIAGTDPADPDDVFRVEIEVNQARRTVWFLARKAEGPGYAGLTRKYTLQRIENPASASWQNVAGATEVVGGNQTVSHQPSGTEAVLLYRAMVALVTEGGVSNALPDDWEIAMFGSAGQDPDADPDHDGETTGNEYISGTHPNNSNDVFRVTISNLGSQPGISFLARKAEGAGYAGRTRLYTVETKPGLSAPSWSALPGWTGVVAANQVIELQPSATNTSSVYRARVELQ